MLDKFKRNFYNYNSKCTERSKTSNCFAEKLRDALLEIIKLILHDVSKKRDHQRILYVTDKSMN